MKRVELMTALVEVARLEEKNDALQAEALRLSKWSCILGDLDRCRHGRHEGDGCYECPGSVSQGNPFMRPDRLLGYDISGRLIRHPGRDLKHDPEAWGCKR